MKFILNFCILSKLVFNLINKAISIKALMEELSLQDLPYRIRKATTRLLHQLSVTEDAWGGVRAEDRGKSRWWCSTGGRFGLGSPPSRQKRPGVSSEGMGTSVNTRTPTRSGFLAIFIPSGTIPKGLQVIRVEVGCCRWL